MPFRNPLALLGLLSAIPLIILYMIRPKPRDILFSSTAFLSEGDTKPTATISRLVTDPLFWIQLFVIILLVVSAAGPFTMAKGTQGSHLVVVIDLSASMEASFDQAKEIVSRYVSGHDRISIVLAENIPAVALREGTKAETQTVLDSIAPRAVPADLSAGMMMAKSLLGAEGGQILIVSDFASWVGDDPDVTKKLIESDGSQVVFVDSGGSGDNVAIVSGWIVESGNYLNYSCLIRNFGRTRTVPIKVSGPGGSSSSIKTIESGSDCYFSFDAFPGVNAVSLEVEDAISADNKAYVYVPEQSPKKVLYLGRDGPALAALKSLPHVTVGRSGDYDRFDLVVVQNATKDGELNRYIYGGGKIVYITSNETAYPEYLPVKITGAINESAPLWVRNSAFAKGIHFDEIGVFGYLDAVPLHNSVTMVEANGVPVISYWRLGSGTVVYMGLDSTRADFYQRPEYPIFWYKMVNWLAEVPDAAESNRRTGEIIRLGEVTQVDTPGGRISTRTLLLDLVGIYRFQGQRLAANMYDAKESNLYGGESHTQGSFTSRQVSEKLVERELAPWLILAVVALIVLELFIIWRKR
ncbi:MAG: BatA domain-containing protein [Methanotrichaceae archaeon]